MITFGAYTLWSCESGGVNYEITPVQMNLNVIEKEVPIGTGYFLKKGGVQFADYQLTLRYHTTAMDDVADNLASVDQFELGTLSVPDWQDIPNCRLVTVGPYAIEEIIPDTVKDYVLSVQLTFRQYP